MNDEHRSTGLDPDVQREAGRSLSAELEPYARIIDCPANEKIVLKGQDSRHLYYIRKGGIEVSYSARETRIIVAIIGADSFVGEIGFFDGISRVRDIRAMEPTQIFVFDHESLERLKEDDPETYGRFMEFMARNICLKFRRILEEREPLTAFAASLTTGRRSYHQSVPLPNSFFQTTAWEMVHPMVENFKARFFDLTHELQKDPQPDIPDALQESCNETLNEFIGQIGALNRELQSRSDRDHVWGFVFKEIYPYFLRSRFAERAYYKPKGYAGDYLMMEMIYENQAQGDGKLGVLVDRYCLDSSASRAVRGRRRLLREQLDLLFREHSGSDRPFQILNLACGPCRELFDFLAQCRAQEKVRALCVDADPQALEHANRVVSTSDHRAAVRYMSENLVKWSLGRVDHDFGPQDVIYSAGLTDYLDRRLFKALIAKSFTQLKPGGVLIIGNFGPGNPDKTFMDHILQWKLIHRDAEELRDLVRSSGTWESIDVLSEEQGVNLFVRARK